MRIATWNIERLKHKAEADKIYSEIEGINADILVLTETDTRISPKYEYVYSTPLSAEEQHDYYRETENRVSIYTNYPCTREYATYDNRTAICVGLDTEDGELLIYGTIMGIFGNREKSFKTDLVKQMSDISSISHNNRKFTAKNVIAERTSENIIYVQEDLREVYHELFDTALERYNAKQKRSDRKIEDYYEKIRQGRQEKLFHELIVQVGNREDSGYGKRDSFEAIWSLEDYMEGFQQRNPNLRVFNAVLHMDEATPHLHIDFVPFSTGNTRGLETKVSFKGAMKAQGFVGTGRQDTEWNRWVRHEKECLAEIMEKYHVEWLQKGTHEKHLSVYDFEKKMRKAEVEELEQTISGQEKKIGEQESALLTNESVLKNQSLQIKENEEKEREMLQRLEDVKEDVRDAESRIDSARTDYEDWKRLADSAYERYKMYQSWGDDEKKSYDEMTDKKEELQKEVANLEKRKSSQNAEISSGEKELEHIRQEMADTQEQMETYLIQAQEQYERYKNMAVGERGSEMFEDMLQLRQENEELKYENRKLRQKLQKAYDFMKQFTINGKNMLEGFLESIGEKVQRFVGSIGSRR